MDAERFDALARAVASRASRRQILAALLGASLIRLGLGAASAQESPAPCASQDQLTQAEAEQLLNDAGITWSSSGNCTDRTNRRCTSFEDIRQGTVDGIIAFQDDSGCDVTITGGTETGHAAGNLSHGNGHKVDIRPTTCVDEYIAANYEEIERRSNGDRQWQSPEGDVYAREGNHWDITYVPKPGAGETRCGNGCCGRCQKCENDACVPCSGCELCVDDRCQPCDTNPCMTCDPQAGSCVPKACPTCQVCDPSTSACAPRECGACQKCEEDSCVTCDPAKCEECVALPATLPSAEFKMVCRSSCQPPKPFCHPVPGGEGVCAECEPPEPCTGEVCAGVGTDPGTCPR
jgi:hypothetical protein